MPGTASFRVDETLSVCTHLQRFAQTRALVRTATVQQDSLNGFFRLCTHVLFTHESDRQCGGCSRQPWQSRDLRFSGLSQPSSLVQLQCFTRTIPGTAYFQFGRPAMGSGPKVRCESTWGTPSRQDKLQPLRHPIRKESGCAGTGTDCN